MKQKTLEEVAEERYGNMPFGIGLERRSVFIAGGKWKEENIPIKILDVDNIYAHIENGVVIIEKNDKDKISYSEEELWEIMKSFDKQFYSGIVEKNKGIKKWLFEEYKKK